jgi:hypothetical protein
MREQENSITCTVATANGFAMPYRSAADSEAENNPVYRTTVAPARKRAARWWAKVVNRSSGTAPSVLRR